MKIQLGDKVKSLIKLSAIPLYTEGVVQEIVNHKFPIGVSMNLGRYHVMTYYKEDELTHA